MYENQGPQTDHPAWFGPDPSVSPSPDPVEPPRIPKLPLTSRRFQDSRSIGLSGESQRGVQSGPRRTLNLLPSTSSRFYVLPSLRSPMIPLHTPLSFLPPENLQVAGDRSGSLEMSLYASPFAPLTSPIELNFHSVGSRRCCTTTSWASISHKKNRKPCSMGIRRTLWSIHCSCTRPVRTGCILPRISCRPLLPPSSKRDTPSLCGKNWTSCRKGTTTISRCKLCCPSVLAVSSSDGSSSPAGTFKGPAASSIRQTCSSSRGTASRRGTRRRFARGRRYSPKSSILRTICSWPTADRNQG